MFTRIVKMEFRSDQVPAFLANFDRIKELIRGFEGCEFLELYQDKSDPDIFFTYSRWNDQVALDKYRKSELFEEVWATTKAMFRSKPQAWSVDTLHSLN